MVNKKGNDKSSRGYCGWHITWHKQHVYLRSRLEYVVACLLDLHKINYITESHIYHIDNSRYKPDFFIYNKKNELIRILEVKYNNKERLSYISKYKKFFNEMNVSYFVLDKKHITSILRKYPDIKVMTNNWCEKSAKIVHDMKGNKNPHFGFKHSDETLKKIGDKTRERFLTKEFRQKHSNSIKKSMTFEVRQRISKFRMGKPTKLVDKVERITPCMQCGNNVTWNEWYKDGILMKSEKKNFCSKSCVSKYIMQEKVNIKRKQQIELMKEFYNKNGYFCNRRDFLYYCKDNNVGCDIRSTFKTHTNFLNYMEELING
jgi:hypothetical protein